MFLRETIAQSIVDWPGLYKDVNYKKSEQKVLDHLFLAIGNGYSWWDGYLVGHFDKTGNSERSDVKTKWDEKLSDYVVKKAPKYGKERFDSTQLTDDFFKTTTAKELAPGVYLPNESRYEWDALSIDPHSAVSTIPDNVRIDWLAGAGKIMEMVIDYFEKNPDWKKKNGLNDWQIKNIGDGLLIATEKVERLLKKHKVELEEFDKIIDSVIVMD